MLKSPEILQIFCLLSKLFLSHPTHISWEITYSTLSNKMLQSFWKFQSSGPKSQGQNLRETFGAAKIC